MAAKDGDTVKVHYTGTLNDGSTFDSSEGKDPLTFTVGSGQVIPGFDEAVRGLEVGEEKTVNIPSAQAYGAPRDELIQEVPKEHLPPEAKEGTMLSVGLPNGQQVPATVKEIKDDVVLLDMNHPLAGKDLNFTVKLEGIEE